MDLPAIARRAASGVNDPADIAACELDRRELLGEVERLQLANKMLDALLSTATNVVEGFSDRAEPLVAELTRLRADSVALTVAENALKAISLLSPDPEDGVARRDELLLSAIGFSRQALTTIGVAPVTQPEAKGGS